MAVQDGYNHLSFVPVIDMGAASVHVKTVVVEIDFSCRQLIVSFRHCSNAEAWMVVSGLSNSIVEQMSISGTRMAIPLELFDSVVDELQMAILSPIAISLPPCELLGNIQSLHEDDPREIVLPQCIQATLRNYQLTGIRQGLKFRGRALIADEMGVGKTLQALSLVFTLESYPLLIVCPSALKFMWATEIEKYLHEQVSIGDVHVIHGSNGALPAGETPRVVIVSYHMVAELAESIEEAQWKCLICDESHILHTNVSGVDARYTVVLRTIGKRAKYCLLLSGTPMLTSPFDMYNQIDILCPGLLGASRWHFALRYCSIQLNPHINVGECIRPTEFISVLKASCLIRRTKREVLELPSKHRVLLRVFSTSPPAAKCRTFQERYSDCWKSKKKGILEAVDYCCHKYDSVVLFGHHIALLDTLEAHLKASKVTFVRIDGGTVPQQREALRNRFEARAVRVALLGITACAVGISLTTAQCAVFCELPPDASWMSQAEDRLHRQGQNTEVVVYYLLGVHSSFDAKHFDDLCNKHRHVRMVTDGGNAEIALRQAEVQISIDPAAHDEEVPPILQSAEPTPNTLLFCVSSNTNRVHLRPLDRSVNFYASFSEDEAYRCVREKNNPVWLQLSTFLCSLNRLSPFHQRQLRRAGTWVPCEFEWFRKPEVSGSRARYALPINLGWGFWWRVKRHYFATCDYFAEIVKSYPSSAFIPLCIACRVNRVRPPSATLSPGDVVEVVRDSRLFCDGRCREAFFSRRSCGSLRQSILHVDGGICSNCHVDCDQLCSETASVESMKDREAIVSLRHPQLTHFPALYQSFIRNPTPGNCWHADHVVPVATGGGEALLDNVQTLCVVCHHLKTKEDMKTIRRSREGNRADTSNVFTSVGVALVHLCEQRRRRVTTSRTAHFRS